jgi:nucleotide-binding universal stress UspA family protein
VTTQRNAAKPALICFDGSDDAVAAIATAGEMLAPRVGVVLTVWEPVASWAPSDPATILSAPLSRLAAKKLDLDEISQGVAQELMQRGIDLATKAGFQVEGRLGEGKPWRLIRKVADEVDAEPIVLGARGLGRVESKMLGSVSITVVFHTKRPVLIVPHHQDDQSSPVAEQQASAGEDRREDSTVRTWGS